MTSSNVGQNESEMNASLSLTVAEMRACGVAMLFGTPDPMPPEIRSVRVKLAMAEREARAASEAER